MNDQTQSLELFAEQASHPSKNFNSPFTNNEKPTWIIQVQSDGGCLGNPGTKYGSYQVHLNGQFLCSESRFGLGFGTNNESEFESLERALQATWKEMPLKFIDPLKTHVVVLTDSTIVRNRLMRKNKPHNYKSEHKRSRAQAMQELTDRCLVLLTPFRHFEARWHGRENNVAIFGH